MMNTLLKAVIKEGVVFRRREFLLSLFVLVYLAVSYIMLSLQLSQGYMLVLQLFFIILENYITVAVYYGIKQSLFDGKLDMKDMFAKGGYFFGRTLYYKLLVTAAGLFIAAFCLSMIEIVKDSSLAAAGFITGFTVLWISFPIYLIMLTLFTPLVIIVEDSPLLPAVRKSMAFARGNLADIVRLGLLVIPLWFFALFLMKVYNKKDFFVLSAIFCFFAVLEIVTIRLFMLFYKARRIENLNPSP